MKHLWLLCAGLLLAGCEQPKRDLHHENRFHYKGHVYQVYDSCKERMEEVIRIIDPNLLHAGNVGSTSAAYSFPSEPKPYIEFKIVFETLDEAYATLQKIRAVDKDCLEEKTP